METRTRRKDFYAIIDFAWKNILRDDFWSKEKRAVLTQVVYLSDVLYVLYWLNKYECSAIFWTEHLNKERDRRILTKIRFWSIFLFTRKIVPLQGRRPKFTHSKISIEKACIIPLTGASETIFEGFQSAIYCTFWIWKTTEKFGPNWTIFEPQCL